MFSRPSGGLGTLLVERPLFVPLLGLPGGLTSLCVVLSCGLNSRPKPADAEFGALLNSAPLLLSPTVAPFCSIPALSAVSSASSSSPLSASLASWLAAASAMARANSSKSPVKLLQRERRTTLCRWCGGGSWWKWWCPLWLWVSLRGLTDMLVMPMPQAPPIYHVRNTISTDFTRKSGSKGIKG
jgi:hypothetical protein